MPSTGPYRRRMDFRVTAEEEALVFRLPELLEAGTQPQETHGGTPWNATGPVQIGRRIALSS